MIQNCILVVEDYIPLQRSVIKDVKRWFSDYEVTGVESYEEARDAIRQNSHDGAITRVVIVDEALKGDLRGSDLIAYIHRYYPGIRKIMLAARARVKDLSKAVNQGCLDKYILKDHYEEKPKTLQVAIKSALAKRDFIYEAITELLEKAEKEGDNETIIIAAGKRQLAPGDLLREIRYETKLGQDHMKNFSMLIYKFFREPNEFLRELERVAKLREKSKDTQIKTVRKRKKKIKTSRG